MTKVQGAIKAEPARPLANPDLLALARRALGLAGLAYTTFDFTTGETFWSPEAYALWGLPVADDPPDAAWVINSIEPADRDSIRAMLADGDWTTRTVEFRISLDHGRHRDLSMTMERTRDDHGRVLQSFAIIRDITDLKAAQTALNERNELLSIALGMGRLGYFYRDVKSQRLIWSPESFEIWGVAQADEGPSGRALEHMIHPDDRDRFVSASFDPEWDNAERFFRIVRPDGAIRHLRSQTKRERNPDGSIARAYGVFQDITPLREMQDALIESDARFRSVFETSGAGIAIADDDGTIRYINAAFARMLGYEIDDLVSRNFKNLSPYGDQDPLVNLADDLRRGAEDNLSLEKRYRHRDGHTVWVRLNISVTESIGLGERMFIGVAQDITDRIVAERRLTESRALLEEAQRLGKIGHWTFVPSTGEIEWSEEMYRIMGVNQASHQPKLMPFREFVHPDDQPDFDLALDELMSGRNSAALEYRIVQPGGAERSVFGRSIKVPMPDGNLRLIGTVQDLTDRRRSEEALRSAIEKAEAANRAKSKFLASMSHELRTPLNAILGFAQLLSLNTRGPLNVDQKSYVDNIVQGGEHLLGLINDVLDLARIDTGQLSVHIEPVRVSDVIARVVRNFQQMAESRTVRVDGQIADLPDLRVMADTMRLTQVIVNLTSNAIKYNRPGGSVAFEAVQNGSTFGRIAVIDTGRGIPIERHHEVFESFNRLGAEAGVEEGTGIGLSLSKSLIEQMGGRIGFDSADGEGSMFWIELPLAQDDDDVTIVEPSER